MYMLAIVGVYACLASGGRVTGYRHASISRCQRSIEQAARDLTLFYPRPPHPLPEIPDPLLEKGWIKKGAAA